MRQASCRRASNPALFDNAIREGQPVYRFLLFGIMLAAQASSSRCDSSSSSSSTNSAANAVPVIVNAGPTNNALNQLFTTVTVCVPATSSCQTISRILVDTGHVTAKISEVGPGYEPA